MDTKGISRHMARKLQIILPRLADARIEAPSNGPPPIDLSMAENHLLRDEILALVKESINENFGPEQLAYAKGFGGQPDLLKAMAAFFNIYFHPSLPVEPEHIITAAGVGQTVDALLFTICDDGDTVLVLGPCWDGFANYFLVHANVEPIIVNASSLDDATNFDIAEALKAAYRDAPDPARIKAVVFGNPNNPIGQCYPPELIRECLRFCSSHRLHFISDEVYALSSFQSQTSLPPFVSVLSLLSDNPQTDMEERYRNARLIDPSYVHVVWGLSKDFGCCGVRLGCVVSQANQALRIGVGLASYWQVSSLSSVVATSLLSSSKLPDIIKLNSTRLSESYRILTNGLTRLKLKYFPANAGMFMLAQLAPYTRSWEEERAALQELAAAGLLVAPLRRFENQQERGWARITFASSPETIEEALKRIEAYLLRRKGPGESSTDVGRPLDSPQDAVMPIRGISIDDKLETAPVVAKARRSTEMAADTIGMDLPVTNKYDSLSRTPSPDDSVVGTE